MAASLYNLARMTTGTTGAGTITLGSAVSGFLSFASAGVSDGETVTYAIQDGTASEIGRGVYTSSGTTLTRSVLKSTNSNAAISLSGSAQVFITAAAEDFDVRTTAETTFGTDNRLVRTDGTGRGVQSSAVTVDDSGNVSGVVNQTMIGYLDVAEISAPANPSANVARLYAYDDGGTTRLRFRDSAGLVTTIGDGTSAGMRNRIINGNFDFWQRGTSTSSAGYLADRWTTTLTGSTVATSRQAFTVGQTDVPYEPTYYLRNVVTSSAGASNKCNLQQRIESVRQMAGQTATLSFWAKADAAKNIAVEFVQNFGTGGSPSSEVTGTGATTCALTTSWQQFSVSVDVPSISGKTLGTNSDDYLGVIFWFDAGSDFNFRTNSLGQQSGTFDIAQVQLEAGSVATTFEVRPSGIELALCQRYYEKSYSQSAYPGTNTLNGAIRFRASSSSVEFPVYFLAAKRATPTVTMYATLGAAASITDFIAGTAVSASTDSEGERGFFAQKTTNGTSGYPYGLHFVASAEL
jgi:hypothetical protein